MNAFRAKIDKMHHANFWGWLLYEYVRYWITLKIPGIIVFGILLNWYLEKPILSQNWISPWSDFLRVPIALTIGYALAVWVGNRKRRLAQEGAVVEAPLSSLAPSRAAGFLLWLLLPREGREAAIGDTEEQFEIVSEKFGPARAGFWLWCEVARSAWPLASYIGERFLKWSLLGSVVDWVRRHV